MGIISDKLTSIEFGTVIAPFHTETPKLQRCSIDTTNGTVTNQGLDIGAGLVWEGGPRGDFSVTGKVWNSVWNDFADFQLLNDKLEYGKCYFDTVEGARICNQRCQMSVVGIASDTFGISVGSGLYPSQVPLAVSGWALAYVDQEYECGSVLTNDENGHLTLMTREEKLEYPERMVAIYKKKEIQELWGPEDRQITVNGRHWVKIK